MPDASTKIIAVLSAVDKMSAVLNPAFANAQKKMEKLEKTKKSFSEIGTKAMLTGGIMTAFFGKTVQDARESEAAVNRLDRVFKNMGDTTGEASRKAQEFAGNLEFKIGVEDEQIMAVQAKLATFKRASDAAAISSGLFNRATVAAFDMQANNSGAAIDNINQLGKALQNPMLGAAALSRNGTVNKEDLPLIKMIQMQKGIPAAQEFLMKAIEKQVKGLAEDTADPLDLMKKGFSEVSEAIGKQILPEVTKYAKKLNEYLPKIIAFVETHKDLIVFVAKAGVALLGIGAVFKIISSVIIPFYKLMTLAGVALKMFGLNVSIASKLAMSAGIVLVIAAIAAGAYLIYKNWDSIVDFFSNAWEKVKEVFSAAWTWIKEMFLNYTAAGLVIKHWDKIKLFFSKLWSGIKNVFHATWEWIKNMFLNYTPQGLIIKHWDKIAAFFFGIWEKVKTFTLAAFQAIKSIVVAPIEYIKEKWRALLDWFSNAWKKVKGWASDAFSWIGNKVKSPAMVMMEKMQKDGPALHAQIAKTMQGVDDYLPHSPAKKGALSRLNKVRIVETIAQTIKPNALSDKMSKVTKNLAGVGFQSNNSVQTNSGGDMNFHFEINLSGGASKSDGDMLTARIKKEISALMKQYNNQKQRVSFG